MHGNRMGPDDAGPKTGRGLGFCNGYDKPGYLNDEAPAGRGRGGYGRGRRSSGRFGRGRGFGGYGYMPAGPGRDSSVYEQELLSRIEKLEAAVNNLTPDGGDRE